MVEKEYQVTLISADFTTAACQSVAFLVIFSARSWGWPDFVFWDCWSNSFGWLDGLGDGNDIGCPWSGDGRDHVTQNQLVFTVDRKTCFTRVPQTRYHSADVFTFVCEDLHHQSQMEWWISSLRSTFGDQFQGEITVALLLPFEVTKKI